MKRLLLLLFVFAAVQAGAQDVTHYKKIIKELSSEKYHGRGYALEGANKAASGLPRSLQRWVLMR